MQQLPSFDPVHAAAGDVNEASTRYHEQNTLPDCDHFTLAEDHTRPGAASD
jgi:hypothetical protein